MSHDDHPNPILLISSRVHDAMIAQAVRESPAECCGLLAGFDGRAESIFPLRNADASPVHYSAETRGLIDAIVAIRNQGSEIVAIYHSHPNSPAIPSKVDLDENYYEDLPRIIISLMKAPPEVRVWRLEAHDFQEVPWRMVETGKKE